MVKTANLQNLSLEKLKFGLAIKRILKRVLDESAKEVYEERKREYIFFCDTDDLSESDEPKAIEGFLKQHKQQKKLIRMKFDEFYQQQFAGDLNLFEQFIDDWDKKRQERLGKGGLDPVDVVKLLPMDLLICLKSRDVTKLQTVLLNMPLEKAADYLDLCINSKFIS